VSEDGTGPAPDAQELREAAEGPLTGDRLRLWRMLAGVGRVSRLRAYCGES